MQAYLVHHAKFFAGLVAAGVATALVWNQSLVVHLLAGGDAFYVAYLGVLIRSAVKSTPQSTMDNARYEDDGLAVIGVLTLGTAALSLTAIFIMLFSNESVGPLEVGLAIAGIPLGWATVHASMAIHYARLYHVDVGKGESRGGLGFPNDDHPDFLDFMYFSFVIGMTAQTADTDIEEKAIRRVALVHGIVSFFYNTVILALSVNAAVQAAS